MTSWKLSLPCTRAEAEAIDASDDIAEGMVLMTTELHEDDREHWRLDAYLEAAPDAATVAAIVALVPSAAGVPPEIETLGEEDWVTLSQQGLEPIAEGRFVVHTSAHPTIVPQGGRAFLIEAGQAFGTGHHATTSGCLAMLDALAEAGAGVCFDRIIDVGTGTGLLAFAARHLWPAAMVIASDIDPRAIAVTAENAALNAIERVELIVADGALDDRITGHAPYDLLIANILAGPLVSMAPEIAALAAPHATIVLAGLLETQRADVAAAFADCGCTLEEVDRRGDWSILRLTAGSVRYIPTAPIDPKGRDGWALDL